MRIRLHPFLALALAVTACQVRPAVPVARSSVAPKAAASRVPVPTVQLLAKPATPSTSLSGVVALDAGYLITNDGGSLITNDGGSIVAQGGGNIVATGGGNIVAVARGALIGNDGASIVSNDGASVLASGAGNLIVADADAVLAADGAAKRRTILADSSAAGQLPAAGMWLRALSMKDGKALPLGVDGAGKPVYVVATDARGAFTIYLPREVAENVRLVASVPHAADAHLTYNHVLPPQEATGLRLDEAHALVSDFLVSTMEDRILELLGGGDPASAKAFAQVAPPALQGLLADLRAKGQEAGFDAMSPPERARLAARIARNVLSAVGLNGTGENANGFAAETLARVQTSLEQVTAKAAALTPAQLVALQARPWAIAANRVQAFKGKPAIAFRKASDVSVLLAQAYVGSVDKARQHQLAAAMFDLGLERARYEELNNVTQDISHVLVSNLVVVGDGLAASFQAAADEQTKAPVAGVPVAEPPLPVAGGNTGVVTTMAGRTAPGDGDGPAASAGITLPLAVALDEPNHRLYVAQDNGVIRMVDLADPAQPVSTLAGKDHAYATKDGPASEALFNAIRAIRVVGTRLFVAEVPRAADLQLARGGVIRMVDLADPAHPVTTVAGKLGDGNHAVGSGAQARFDLPCALATDAAGDLYITDLNQHVVLKMDLHGGQYATSVVAGIPEGVPHAIGFDGPPKEVELGFPGGLTFDAKGALVMTDGRWIRRLGEDGILRVIAGGSDLGEQDGFWLDATLGGASGLTTLPDGDILVAENVGARLRRLRLTADGRAAVVWTAAGPTTEERPLGSLDGVGPAARFYALIDVTADAAGTIYVPEFSANRLRRVTF